MPRRQSSLARLAVLGAAWAGASQFVGQFVRLVGIALLARLITPDDYGVVSMALIVTGVLTLINELGLAAAIVQRPQLEPEQLTTALWASLGAGLALAALAIASAPLAARFFRDGRVTPVLSVLALGFVFSSLGLVHRALLQRQLDFRRLAYTEVGAEVAFAVTAALLGLAGAGIWAFVGALLARPLSQSALLWRTSSWRPQGRPSAAHLRPLLRFGSNVMGTSVVNYARSNVDYLVVGRRLGDQALGLYTVAYQVTTLPVLRLASIVTRVAFPVFSGVQTDRARLRRGYARAECYIAMVTLPLVAGLGALAHPFTLVVLGPKWTGVAPLIQILAVAVGLKAVSTAAGSVLKACGRPDLELRWNLVVLAVTTVAVLVGVHYGTRGVAVAMTASTLFAAPGVHFITNRLIGLSWRRLGGALAPAVVSTLGMLAAIALVENWLTAAQAGPLVRLVVGTAVGGLVYLGVLLTVGRKPLGELLVSLGVRQQH